MKEKKYPITKKNEKSITEFLDSLKAKGTPDLDTIINYETSIRKILFLLNKDISKITEGDLDKVFSGITNAGTKELNKTKFKKFLKFKKLEKLADHIKISSSYFKKPIKTADDVLSEDEINKVRNSQNSNRDLAIFELFLTTGIRREELASLKTQSIQILKDEIKVKVPPKKTKERTISIIPYPNNPIAFYPKHFVAYYNNHPFKNENNKPLFYSGDFRRPGMEFEVHAINQIIHKIGKKAGVTKKITPHILRHTSATYDGYHLPEQSLMLKYGWKTPDMARTYCHMKEEQLNGFLKQKAGLTPQIVEQESKCPFCGHINNINAITCINCKRTINKEEMARQQQQQEEREKGMKKLIDDLENNIKILTTDSKSNLAHFYYLWFCINHGNSIKTEDGRIINGNDNETGFIAERDRIFIKNLKSITDENGNQEFNENSLRAFENKKHEFQTLLAKNEPSETDSLQDELKRKKLNKMELQKASKKARDPTRQ